MLGMPRAPRPERGSRGGRAMEDLLAGETPHLSGDCEDVASDREPELLPEDFDGYEILRILGRGGMSVVYEARQAKLDRGVALKMLVGGVHASSRAVARLRAESATIAGLRHPGIVAIHDVG